jgi:hypothetical protein
MKPTSTISFVIMLMILLVLTGSSITFRDHNIIYKAVVKSFLIWGFKNDYIINRNNSHDYDENHDNYFRVSTENKEDQRRNDICGKLLEECQVGTAETNATSKNNKNVEEINKKYLEQGSVENQITRTENDTAARASVLKNNNLIQTVPGDFQTYENSKLGIKLLYPDRWEKEENLGADRVTLISPREDENDLYLQTIDLFVYPSMSVNQTTQSLTNYYQASLKNFTSNVSPRTTTNANFSILSMNYTYNDDKARTIRAMDFIVSSPSSDKTYLFTFRDEASSFEKDLPVVKRILNSVNLSR